MILGLSMNTRCRSLKKETNQTDSCLKEKKLKNELCSCLSYRKFFINASPNISSKNDDHSPGIRFPHFDWPRRCCWRCQNFCRPKFAARHDLSCSVPEFQNQKSLRSFTAGYHNTWSTMMERWDKAAVHTPSPSPSRMVSSTGDVNFQNDVGQQRGGTRVLVWWHALLQKRY